MPALPGGEGKAAALLRVAESLEDARQGVEAIALQMASLREAQAGPQWTKID
jgi:hypothetical protein